MYLTLKFAHIVLAAISISGFVLRGFWMMTDSGLLANKVVRIAPHVVDTLFLASGIALVVQLSLPLMQSPWLLAKLGALVVYIVLGTLALRRGPTMPLRQIAFVGALSAFAYIVGAAIAKSPASWIALLVN